MNLLTEWTIISCAVLSGCVGMRYVARSSTCSHLGFKWGNLNQSSGDIQIQLNLCKEIIFFLFLQDLVTLGVFGMDRHEIAIEVSILLELSLPLGLHNNSVLGIVKQTGTC